MDYALFTPIVALIGVLLLLYIVLKFSQRLVNHRIFDKQNAEQQNFKLTKTIYLAQDLQLFKVQNQNQQYIIAAGKQGLLLIDKYQIDDVPDNKNN